MHAASIQLRLGDNSFIVAIGCTQMGRAPEQRSGGLLNRVCRASQRRVVEWSFQHGLGYTGIVCGVHFGSILCYGYTTHTDQNGSTTSCDADFSAAWRGCENAGSNVLAWSLDGGLPDSTVRAIHSWKHLNCNFSLGLNPAMLPYKPVAKMLKPLQFFMQVSVCCWSDLSLVEGLVLRIMMMRSCQWSCARVRGSCELQYTCWKN